MPTDSGRRGSVLIPAHDEAATIGHALETLLMDAEPGEFDVVVACNGCRDDTAAVARAAAGRLGHQVAVLELPLASKTAAWRAAESVSREPRLYLDADVECPTETARQLLSAVVEYDVAVPTRRLSHEHGSLLARLYYQGWTRLPWVAAQLAGRGAFALSPAARATFGEFPDLVADDRFATTRVPRERAAVVKGDVVVRPPSSLRAVLAVRVRVLSGNVAPEVPTHDPKTRHQLATLLATALQPMAWPALTVYVAVTVVAKVRVRRFGAAHGGWAGAARDVTQVTAAGQPVTERAAETRPTLSAAPSLSVVIVTHQSAGHIERCLTALLHALGDAETEIVIVDNGSDDDTVARARRSAPHARVVLRDNDGFARGCLAGAKETSGQTLLFLNPDVVLDAGTVTALRDELSAVPSAGIVGGRAVDVEGTTVPGSWWGRPSLWSLACFASGLSSLLPGSRWFDPEAPRRWRGESRAVDIVSGAVMLVDRKAWARLGGFDARMLLYGEDADLCLRARAAGYGPRVTGAATFRHAVGGSASDAGSRLVLVLRGRASVVLRHLPAGTRRLGGLLLLAGVWLRASAPAARPGRVTTTKQEWSHAWHARGQWRRGWQVGDVLGGAS